MDEKIINDIVWWIPIKKLRNAVREYLICINNLSNSINNLNNSINNINRNDVSLYSHYFNMREYMLNNPEEFKENIKEFKKNLDEYSLEVLDCYLKQMKYLVNDKLKNRNFLNIDNTSVDFFTNEQKIVWYNRNAIVNYLNNKYAKKYDLKDVWPCIHINYYELGIVYLPSKIKKRFKDSIAIDGGAWIGDSAIMLHDEYDFKEIYAFEPISEIYKKLINNLEKYNLSKRIKAYKYALSNNNNISYMLNLDAGSRVVKEESSETEEINSIKLDDFFKNINTDISLIKLDVEGFEEQALEGAVNIIKKYKPVLLISCYHDSVALGQMFRIKKWIENLKLNYKILYRGLTPDCNFEYNLICYVEN